MSEVAELRALRAVVDQYAKGCQTGDVSLLKEIFHPDARMYGASDGELADQPITRMFELVDETPTGDAHQVEIVSIDRHVDAATVVIIEEGYLGRDYWDHLNLVRVDGAWQITNKTYQRVN